MADCSFTLVQFAERDHDILHSTQEQILQELSAGRDVLLLCENEVLTQLECMTFASLAFRSLPGRLAIVTRESADLSSRIPRVMAERLHTFSTQNDAVRWLRPQAVTAKATLRFRDLTGRV